MNLGSAIYKLAWVKMPILRTISSQSSDFLTGIAYTVVNSPANTRRWINVGLILARRLRRRPNIKTTLDQRLVFAGSGTPGEK